MSLRVAVMLIHLTGPGDQVIELNPDQLVTSRAPRSSDHFAPGTHCLINTADGKVVAVKEDCETVERLIDHGR